MDREKFIEALENADVTDGVIKMSTQVRDLLVELLKEQEKAKVVFGRCKDGSFATECGNCGMYLDKAYSICPKCNKELDWNSNQN